MKYIKILSVGKIKTVHWQQAVTHYAKRLSYTVKLDHQIVKDATPKLPKDIGIKQEAERLSKLVKPSDILICLDEAGSSRTSLDFSRFLGNLYDQGKTPCFCIGGAYGLAAEIKQKALFTIAFGPMTFPHELALVLLFEQLYRAETILMGTGYHH